jgi:hypothetical protein
MSTAEIREKLSQYIRVADEKKINAIYTLLEGEIAENTAWWENNEFTNQLDERLQKYKSGASKGYTLQEVEASIEELRQNRKA